MTKKEDAIILAAKIGFVDDESLSSCCCSHAGCPEAGVGTLREVLTRWVPEDLCDPEVGFADFDGKELQVVISGTVWPAVEEVKANWNWPADFEDRCVCCAGKCGCEHDDEFAPMIQWSRWFRLPCTRASAARFLRMLGAFGFANSVDGKYGGF